MGKTRHTLHSELAASRGGLSKAALDILAERRRQIEAEGWSEEHDDQHTEAELAMAASCYAAFAAAPGNDTGKGDGIPPTGWPWEWSWWKPKDRRRDLVRAGALIIAEIERLDRPARPAEQKEGEGVSEMERAYAIIDDCSRMVDELPTVAEFATLKRENAVMRGMLSRFLRPVIGPPQTPMWEQPDGSSGQFPDKDACLNCWITLSGDNNGR